MNGPACHVLPYVAFVPAWRSRRRKKRRRLLLVTARRAACRISMLLVGEEMDFDLFG